MKITSRRLHILQNKVKFNKSLTDKRGKHCNRPHKISENVIAFIKSHTELFPKQESHYSRGKNEDSYYLSAELNTRKMYKLFCDAHPDVKCSEHTYRDIFKSDYKLRFGLPRSDTCSYCDRLFLKICSAESDDQIKHLEIESKLHHARAHAAYKLLAADTDVSAQNPGVVVIVDLQQVIFFPQLTHSKMFYQRQYSCYNLAIHELSLIHI